MSSTPLRALAVDFAARPKPSRLEKLLGQRRSDLTREPESESARDRLCPRTEGARSPGRDPALDLLKILAMLGVLNAHALGILPGATTPPDTATLAVHLAFIAGFVFCIPVFVMCSGAVLLGRADTRQPLAFYRKRLPHLVVPLVVWSAVYFVVEKGPGAMSLAAVPLFLNRLLAGKVLGVFWFLYMMLGVSLSAPFLGCIVRQASRAQLWLFAVLCLFIAPLPQYFARMLSLDLSLDVSVFTLFVGFFVLGHLLQTARPLSRRGRLGWLTAYLLLSAAAVLGQLYFQTYCATAPYNFFDFTAVNVVIVSMAAFALVRNLPSVRLAAWARPLRVVANATYGMYLVHILVCPVLGLGLRKVALADSGSHPVAAVVLATLSLFGLTLAVVLVLSRIPYLRLLVGYRAA
jgi:surface polysaccharide O-acyltransferase-like enzyme